MTAVEALIKNKPESVVAHAYRVAKAAHAGQLRQDGTPYFSHVLGTAENLTKWQLDEASIAAGLLHDMLEDTPTTLEELKAQFGAEIAFLVDGVTKLKRLRYRDPHANVAVENMRKLVFALSQDLRVILIKLADRLHNMRTLASLPKEKQKRIALETSEVYAPIAYRLGMQNLSGELQDLSFPYLFPKENKWLHDQVKEVYVERETYLKKSRPNVKKALHAHGIHPLAIDLRAKRYSSLYHKLVRHNMDITKIYDLVAMRIIVENVRDCYGALGAIHEMWPPLPGRIKDYIAMPKPNGYRSLHTTVIGPDQKFIEIQIRTHAMHEENENGVAAHWLYEQYKIPGMHQEKSPQNLTKELKWIQQLKRWQEKYQDSGTGEASEDFLEAMKVDFFKDRIFAITPHGDVMDLPAGSTPIDFAYHIHTEIGNTCVAAKVNDQFVSLNHELRSGDLVEILTQKNKKPSEDWLQFVKTGVAKEHIRAALREKDQRLTSRRGPSKVEFRMVIQNRLGLLRDISGVIARSHFHITSMNTTKQSSVKFPIIRIDCELEDVKKINRLILKLKTLKEVHEISYRIL
jgi:GTP diphosphokinase / guanosine-3',5'-bis(diphosphate) 3'-diphosphatase